MTDIPYDRQAGRVLGAWLKAQRPPSGSEIARRAGVSRQFVSRILAGQARPTPVVIRACSELGLPIDLIFGQAINETAPALERRKPRAGATT